MVCQVCGLVSDEMRWDRMKMGERTGVYIFGVKGRKGGCES